MNTRQPQPLEQLLGRIRKQRALEAEFEPFSPYWYNALSVEARLIAELRTRFPGLDVDAVEWLVAQR